jgi:hypothetical protein
VILEKSKLLYLVINGILNFQGSLDFDNFAKRIHFDNLSSKFLANFGTANQKAIFLHLSSDWLNFKKTIKLL